MVPSSELLERVRERFPTIDKAPPELNETARSWQIPGHKVRLVIMYCEPIAESRLQGSLGFISSMSDHFCATCNRLRLTADGQIKVNSFLHISSERISPSRGHRCACLTPKKSPCATSCAMVAPTRTS